MNPGPVPIETCVALYWLNETTGDTFCLVEAPSKEAAIEVHREAHGLIADEIIEVQEGV